MKLWKRLGVAVLVLALALSLCACGSDPEKALYGTWTYKMDLAAMIDVALEDALGEPLPVDADLELPLVFTFNKDKSFTMTTSNQELKSGFETYMEALKQSVVELMYQQAEEMDMSREEFDAAFVSTFDTTVEEYCGELMDSLVDDSLLEEISTDWSGTFRVREDRLFVAETEQDLSEDVYLTYTLEGDTLAITGVTGDALDLDSLDAEFPMEFVRQSGK